MKVADGVSMARIDREAQEKYGIPGIVLMENAALNAYREFLSRFGADHRTLVFVAGPGNNGGDALAMARHAHIDGHRVSVVLLREKNGELASVHLGAVRALGIGVSVWPEPDARSAISSAEFLFDGLFGTGMRPPLDRACCELVEFINDQPCRTVAIDVPSGVCDGFLREHVSVDAEVTLTIGIPKLALFLPAARVRCGEIVIIPAGFPKALLEADALGDEFVDAELVTGLRPAARADLHKGSRGRVGVFAGCAGLTGAAILGACAAARVGAGLVYLNVDSDIYPVIASHLTSIVVRADRDVRSADFATDVARYDALLVGPGWGLDRGEPALRRLLGAGVPGVLDADGLTLLAGIDGSVDLGGRWVLTPHPGELSRLAGVPVEQILDRPFDYLRAVSRAYRATVVYKAHVTIIEAPDGRRRIVDGMNPYLGTGGSGDVLSGAIAGLIARGVEPFDAATLGAAFHAEAGRVASRGGWFLAEDLLVPLSAVAGAGVGVAG